MECGNEFHSSDRPLYVPNIHHIMREAVDVFQAERIWLSDSLDPQQRTLAVHVPAVAYLSVTSTEPGEPDGGPSDEDDVDRRLGGGRTATAHRAVGRICHGTWWAVDRRNLLALAVYGPESEMYHDLLHDGALVAEGLAAAGDTGPSVSDFVNVARRASAPVPEPCVVCVINRHVVRIGTERENEVGFLLFLRQCSTC